MLLNEKIRAARRASVPLVVVETPDAAACVRTLVQDSSLAAVADTETSWVSWDCADGLKPLGNSGVAAVALISSGEQIADPATLLLAIRKAPPGSVVIFHNAQRFIGDTLIMQAILNLRDLFKQNFRMLILMGPSVPLPVELRGHVVVLGEPLPDESRIRAKMQAVVKDAKVDVKISDGAVDSQRGLIEFAVEQNTAMNLRKSGIDEVEMWTAKRKLIAETPGLQMLEGKTGFSGVGGVRVVKDYLSRILNGKRRPKAIVYIDEIEKSMAGTVGDTSGVSQDQLQCLLSHMQDKGATGILLLGPPGAAKSATAKAAGVEAGVPTIKLDLGATKGSLVGESERQLRDALEVIDAVSSGESLWIATCNSVATLPPELRRRFTLGTFFFDLPDEEERKEIWKIYCGGKVPKSLPDDTGWTGAEIERCADIADRLGVSLQQAADFVVPVSVSAADQISALRQSATGKYLSASYPGTYVPKQEFAKPEQSMRRRVAVGD